MKCQVTLEGLSAFEVIKEGVAGGLKKHARVSNHRLSQVLDMERDRVRIRLARAVIVDYVEQGLVDKIILINME